MRSALLTSFFVLLCFSIQSNAINIESYAKSLLEFVKDYDFMKEFNSHMNHIHRLDQNYHKFTPSSKSNLKFSCDTTPSQQNPTSVHKLRPSDIRVIGAIGDSLTAALGAKADNVLGLVTENRGVSWSIGGDSNLESFFTLPNLFKKYNSNIKGFSTGNSLSLVTKKGVALNVAVSGQEANHILEQARLLVKRIRDMKGVNFNDDWKLVTIFIGGNDLCDYCSERALHTPEAYINYIRDTLDYLQHELPRTFVNLVAVLNVNEVKQLNQGFVCSALHKAVCPCAAYPKSSKEEQELKEYISQYHNFTDSLVNSGRYDVKDDFTVVVQPYYKDFSIPRTQSGEIDLSYFAPDCFHFSLKGQAGAALGLWNNMLQPVGKKSTTWFPDESILCTTDQHPYIFTNKNSIN